LTSGEQVQVLTGLRAGQTVLDPTAEPFWGERVEVSETPGNLDSDR